MQAWIFIFLLRFSHNFLNLSSSISSNACNFHAFTVANFLSTSLDASPIAFSLISAEDHICRVSLCNLYFVQAWFGGEKIGEGLGRTRREAQHQAAEGSLRHLASKIHMICHNLIS